MKKIAILPTLLTLGNAVCGFSAIVSASKIDRDPATDVHFWNAALLILAAMFFDVLDGYVARLSKTASEFGGELDSLCDAISFGAAPAFLILRLCASWEPVVIRNSVAGIAALYMVCAILRLARFNVETSPDPAEHRRFKGLPSPAAAGCIVSLAIVRSHVAADWLDLDRELVERVVRVWAPLGGLLVALLMVSRVSYPHLTKQVLRGRRRFTYLRRIILAVFVLALARELSVVILFWGYALGFLLRHLVVKARRTEESSGSGPLSVVGGQQGPADH